MRTLAILVYKQNVGKGKSTELNVFGTSTTGCWKMDVYPDHNDMILVIKDGNEYIAYDCTIIRTIKVDDRYKVEFTWKSNTSKLKTNFRDMFGQHPSQWHYINKCEIFCN